MYATKIRLHKNEQNILLAKKFNIPIYGIIIHVYAHKYIKLYTMYMYMHADFKTYLFSTLVKESKGSVLSVSEASLLNERSEDLSVKEVREER